MKNLYHRFILIACIFSVYHSTAYARDFYLDNMMSVQTGDMIRYGEAPTSLFTGSLDLTIPIFSLEDPDFDLDIALCYNSEGFKPFKNSGYTGQDWILQAGGCISREVRNYPDEMNRTINSGHKQRGMYNFLRYNHVDKYDVFEQNPNIITNCNGSGNSGFQSFAGYNIGTDCTTTVDYMPDIYHFSFCGYHGIFTISNNGKAVVLSGDYVSVNLSKTLDNLPGGRLSSRPLPVDTSKITIKTIDGYTYIFGGDISALEYSLTLKDSQQEQNQVHPIVNTWYLKQIIAPNKRTITYYYTPYRDEYGGVDDHTFAYNLYDDYFAIPLNHEHSFNYRIKYSHTKECVLDSIIVSGEQPLKVHFYKSLARKKFNVTPFDKCYENYSLDSIVVTSSMQTIRTVHLDYEYKAHRTGNSDAFYWRFLSAISISGEGIYSLSYNHERAYPDLHMETNDDIINTIDSWGYWKVTSRQGMLNEIIFPTGGKQQFIFEENTYSTERRLRRTNMDKDIEIYSYNLDRPQTTGGVRIGKIQTYANDNTMIEEKIFSYNQSETNVSSGVLYNNLMIFPENENGWIIALSKGDYYSLLESHIGYSYVEERIRNGQGTNFRNTYKYDTGREHFTTYNDLSINRYTAENDTSIFGAFSSVLTYDKNLTTKGKLLSEKYYKGDTLVKSVTRRYNGVPLLLTELIPTADIDPLGCIDTLVIFCNYADKPVTRKLFIYPDVKTQEVVTTHGQGTPLLLNRSYRHDNKLRIVSETVNDSKWITRFTQYTYPDELNAPYDYFDPSALSLLVENHRLNTPVEEVSGFVENNTTYITSGKANLYAAGEYFYLRPNAHHAPPHIIIDSTWYSIRDSLIFQDSLAVIPMVMKGYYPFLYKSLSLSLTEPVTNYQPMSADGGTVTFDPRYKLDTEYLFDYNGRLRSKKPFGTTATTYTWDGIYPVSKTTGNQTWTYTYIPHVGVNSITTPRGITTYYTYDKYGRLIEEYQLVNGKKQILNVYYYHIKTEQL